MAGEIGNPLGYVPVFDGGDPGIVTVIADAVISGGAPVYFSGADGNVGSQTESFKYTNIIALTGGSELLFNGVAIATAASGAPVAVATKGVIIGVAVGAVTSGRRVMVLDGGFIDIGSAAVDANGLWAQKGCGRAMSSAGSEEFALIQLSP